MRQPGRERRSTPARLVPAAALALTAAFLAGPAQAAKMFSLSLDDVANGRAEVIDLTHDLKEGIPLFPGGIPFTLEPLTQLAD
ncbi:MAG: hypothetical protein AAB249_03545, partial [Acidobacteriota bacterium]